MKRPFDLYLLGRGLAVDSQRRVLLLHVAGLDVQATDYTLLGNEQPKDYNAMIKVLDDYFIPENNVSFERHLFIQIVQKSKKTFDQFMYKPKQQATSCDSAVEEDDYNRDQLIGKCCSNRLRRKFLKKSGLVKLDVLLVIARAQEAIEHSGQAEKDQFDTERQQVRIQIVKTYLPWTLIDQQRGESK